jgi:hypothetical protein
MMILTLVTLLTGCFHHATETPKSTGFLENYELLKPVPSPEGTHFFSYENPNMEKSDYYAVIIEPVYVYQDPHIESNVAHENIEKARRGIDEGLIRALDKKYTLTQNPGPGVMRLKVAITGAYVEAEGFKIWNIIPVSAAITLAKKATHLDTKHAILIVELKFSDSQTGELIKETVTTMTGKDFHNNQNINAQFDTLAQGWTEQALPVF